MRASSNGARLVFVRFDDDGTVRIGEYDNGQWTTRASASVSESYNQWYDVRILTEGDAVTVWRGPKGGAMEQVVQCSGVGYTDSDRLWFQTNYWATYDLDDIVVVGGSMGATTTTFTYTDANELATQTVNGVTTAFTYDAWGRMVEKAVQGGPSAAYEYRWGDKLYSVASTFPGEGTVTFQYGGDGKRRSRTAGGVTTKYRWDAGWNLLNQETAAGVLAETNVYADPRAGVATLLAQASGATPGAGAYDHYVHDHLGSTRGVFDASKALLSDFEYTPYGTQYAQAGGIALPELPAAFTGKPFEAAAGMYAFPYRMYAAELGRWLGRDPLGMVDGPNVYGYVRGNPAGRVDSDGRSWFAIGVGVWMACPLLVIWGNRVYYDGFDTKGGWAPNTNDDYKHCVATCRGSRLCGNPLGAGLVGVLGEALDMKVPRVGGGASDPGESARDMASNADGLECSVSLLETCESCCKRKGYDPSAPYDAPHPWLR